MRHLNGMHTALSFILPKADPAFRERYPTLFAELADSGFHVAEVIVEDGHQTMEQALFVLANEMHESDVIVLADVQSATYDFVELSARSLSSFPAAKIALIAADPANASPAVFQRAKSLHYVIDAAHVSQLTRLGKGASEAEDDSVIKNDELVRMQSKLEQIVTTYTKKDIGDEFSDIRLNTPVAPKALPPEDSVAALFARPRTPGRVLLVIPSQFNVYGVNIKPAYPALGVMWVAAMLERAGHACEIIDVDADGVDLAGVLKELKQERSRLEQEQSFVCGFQPRALQPHSTG